jgi:endogenous inhibitor of DNA gyrase (YacG/DUF329 family)
MSLESHPEMKKSLTRRDSILKASSALAGMALVPGSLKPNPAHSNISSSMPAQKIRIGVVGGGFGSDFYWHKHPNCIVQAVSDLREDRRKRLMDIYRCSNVYNSLEDLIKDQSVDAVAVFSGAPDHVRHCTACSRTSVKILSGARRPFSKRIGGIRLESWSSGKEPSAAAKEVNGMEAGH